MVHPRGLTSGKQLINRFNETFAPHSPHFCWWGARPRAGGSRLYDSRPAGGSGHYPTRPRGGTSLPVGLNSVTPGPRPLGIFFSPGVENKSHSSAPMVSSSGPGSGGARPPHDSPQRSNPTQDLSSLFCRDAHHLTLLLQE